MAGARGRARRGRASCVLRRLPARLDPALLPADAADGARRRDRRAGAGTRRADGRDCRTDRRQWRRRPVHRLRPSAVRRRRHAAGGQGTSLRGRAGKPGRGRSHRACRLCGARGKRRRAWARGTSHDTGRLPARHGNSGACRAPRRGRRRCGAPETAGRSRAPGRPRCHGHAVQGAGNCAARRFGCRHSPPPIDLHPCPAAVSRPGTRIGTARRQVS